MTYSERLKDPRWQRKRLEVMQRDGFKCRDCGSETETLHVHHCHYERGAPWETNSVFMLTLCDKCHKSRQEMECVLTKMCGKILAETSQQRLAIHVDRVAKAHNQGLLFKMFVAVDKTGKEAIPYGW